MTNREIDALVAEKVMEWTDSPVRNNGTGIPYRLHWAIKANWSPSTDPAASKQLRDKMRADGWQYTLKFLTAWQPNTFECVFYGPGKGLHERGALTEEMAVALAALKAHGVDVPHP